MIVGIVAIGLGAIAPVTSHSGPYLSTLSNASVKSAEACPCNFKVCLQSTNTCIDQGSEEDPMGCCFYQGQCRSLSCL